MIFPNENVFVDYERLLNVGKLFQRTTSSLRLNAIVLKTAFGSLECFAI